MYNYHLNDDDFAPNFDFECDIKQARTNVALKFQEYDELFFEKKDLIIYEIQGNSYGYYRYEISSIKYKENIVYLTLKEREKKGTKLVIGFSGKHLIVIEIDKRDNYGNDTLEVIIKKGGRFTN